MPATPNITLTATLDDLTGAAAGSTANPAKLRIALCGFGPALPLIIGTAMLARTGPFNIYSTGAAISTLLWGNDQISPAGTYYSIEILDGEDNVVQCGAYQFTGGPRTVDLSSIVQILPPFGFPLSLLQMLPCTPNPVTVGGTTAFTATGAAIVVAVFYNGVLLRPVTDYTVTSFNVITLTFPTEIGDNVYALCVA